MYGTRDLQVCSIVPSPQRYCVPPKNKRMQINLLIDLIW
jgi:hypothetical protein